MFLPQTWKTGPNFKGRKEPLMIVKTPKGYQVKSEKGKNLSKPSLSKQQAEKRLKQVEYFKHKKGK
jgi:hypothetical protein